ncbi:MAG: hypothetical protein K0S23_1417 [Fluviicola sp.]|uniref:hypothetical protein n=1 Tax=Fluviicola sp. TaxID=1917219 RepID=UPI00260B1920|nr:hypothetical protein [Fluviicola sp.]MDF3027110.1 hypothetical protein [Fluviicola sp.]
MNPEEILTILRVESPDEVEEAIETELFEIKKSILAKPLLRLTLKSKLARLDLLAKISESQQLYQNDQVPQFRYDLHTNEEVLVLWESYMKAKSQWKIAFTQMQTPRSLIGILEEGLAMERAFSEQFEPLTWLDEEPVFGVEPDPMLIQNGLKQAARRGWLTFSDLEKNKSELEKDLLLAIKRLSLLPKYL